MPIATNPATGEVMYLGEDGQWQPAQKAINPQTHEMLAFDGRDWKPVPVSKGVIGYIDDAVRSVASGITFGFADELAAKMDELTGRGGTYEQNVARERARDAQIPTSIKLPGEVAGAVASTVTGAPVAAGAAAAALPARVAQTLRGLPEVLKYFGLGAAEGALAGAGGAKEDERLSGAATGAAVGGAVGAAAPSVVRGVTSVAQNVAGAVRPSSGAAADIGRAIARDEDTPAALLARQATAEAERPGVATIADVGGENVRGLVERVAQTPGAGRTQVVPTLTARQEQQADRLVTDLRTLTGTAKTANQAIDDTIAARATAAKPLYDEAFKFDAASSPEVMAAFDKATSTGFGKAVLQSSSLKKSLQTEYGVDDIAQAPKMVLIDAWKKEVDDLVGTAKREGKSNAVRVLSRMRDDVVKAVDEANPAYGKARNAWAGPSAYLDAIEDGRDILSRNVSSDEFAAKFARLSDADKEAQRIGAISAIVSRIGNDTAKLPDITKYLRSPEIKAKIAAIMPTDEAAAAWKNRLSFEVASSELTGRSLGNSATARRLAEQNDAKGVVGDLVMDALASGPSTIGVLRRVFSAGPRWLRDTIRSRTDKEVADLLLNPDRAADLPRIIQRAQTMKRATGTRGAASTTAGGVATFE
jgi:hypothetical protein